MCEVHYSLAHMLSQGDTGLTSPAGHTSYLMSLRSRHSIKQFNSYGGAMIAAQGSSVPDIIENNFS